MYDQARSAKHGTHDRRPYQDLYTRLHDGYAHIDTSAASCQETGMGIPTFGFFSERGQLAFLTSGCFFDFC